MKATWKIILDAVLAALLIGVLIVWWQTYKQRSQPLAPPSVSSAEVANLRRQLEDERALLAEDLAKANKAREGLGKTVAGRQQQLAQDRSKPPQPTPTPQPAPRPAPAPQPAPRPTPLSVLPVARPVPEILIAHCPVWPGDTQGAFPPKASFESSCPRAAQVSMTLAGSLPESFGLTNKGNTRISLTCAPENKKAATVEVGYAEIEVNEGDQDRVVWKWVNLTGKHPPSAEDCKTAYDLVSTARIDAFDKEGVPVLAILFTPGQMEKDTPFSIIWPQASKPGWPNVADRKKDQHQLFLRVAKNAPREFQEQAVWNVKEDGKGIHLKWITPKSIPSKGEFSEFRKWLDDAVQRASLAIGYTPVEVKDSGRVDIPIDANFPWTLLQPELVGSPNSVWSLRPGKDKTTIEFDRGGTTLVAAFNYDTSRKPQISVSWEKEKSPLELVQKLESLLKASASLPGKIRDAQDTLDMAKEHLAKARTELDQATQELNACPGNERDCLAAVNKTDVPRLDVDRNTKEQEIQTIKNNLKDLEGAQKEIPKLQKDLNDQNLYPWARQPKTDRLNHLVDLQKNPEKVKSDLKTIPDLQKKVDDLKQNIADTKAKTDYNQKWQELETAKSNSNSAPQKATNMHSRFDVANSTIGQAGNDLANLRKDQIKTEGSIKTIRDNLGEFAAGSRIEFIVKADKTDALLAIVTIDVPTVEISKDQGGNK